MMISCACILSLRNERRVTQISTSGFEVDLIKTNGIDKVQNGIFVHAATVYHDYIHKVPDISHENLQRESHKPYSPPTSVT
jgi:hypothetical protein